jgi:hypothetical protein
MSKPYFGACPICRQGVLLAVVRLDTEKVIAMCHDCEVQIAGPDQSVALPESNVRDASQAEANATGWMVHGYT